MGGYIVVSSITYAYKSRDILERRGCRVRVERASTEISKCGCHFLLIIHGLPLQQALALLDAAHVHIIKAGGDYHDLF